MTRDELKALMKAKAGCAPAVDAVDPSFVFSDDFRVLVVDDVVINCRILEQDLRRLGVTQIDTAQSGAEALRLAAQKAPNVVFTDLWMPEVNGEDLLRKLRALPGLAGVPVIGLSADEDADKIFNVEGFTALLTKPVDLPMIQGVLHRIVQH